MNSLERVAKAWLIAWGIGYIVTAAMTPSIGGEEKLGTAVYALLGMVILMSLACRLLPERREGPMPVLSGKEFVRMAPYEIEGPRRNFGRVMLALLGVVMVVGCVASWTGATVWNVPFANKEMFQVSMALLDLVSAVFMFILAE